jgi:hypothetical protein
MWIQITTQTRKKQYNEKEADDICNELGGLKEWSDDDEEEKPSWYQINEELKEQGVNQQNRRTIIHYTSSSKSTKITVKEYAKQEKILLEDMIPKWTHDYLSVFEKENFDKMPPH